MYDAGKEDYLRPSQHIGLGWVAVVARHWWAPCTLLLRSHTFSLADIIVTFIAVFLCSLSVQLSFSIKF